MSRMVEREEERGEEEADVLPACIVEPACSKEEAAAAAVAEAVGWEVEDLAAFVTVRERGEMGEFEFECE